MVMIVSDSGSFRFSDSREFSLRVAEDEEGKPNQDTGVVQ